MLLTGILIIIMSNAVTLRRDKSILFSKSGMMITLVCFIISINSFYISFIDQGIGLFGGTFVSSVVTHIFQIFVFLITFLILQLNSFYPRKVWTEHYCSLFDYILNNVKYFNSFILNKMSQQYRILEYPIIIMFALMGGIFLISSNDLISVFVSIELQSYALYILCALYRNSERPLSGALTYFLLGGLSSCFILLAIALLYVNSGHTSFDNYYIMNGISDLFTVNNINSEFKTGYENSYKNFSLAVMSIGFLFKISAAPFHFWSPDVYDAIPTIVTTFVAIFAKISILVLLLELVHFTSNNFSNTNFFLMENSPYNISWTFTLLLSSLLSLVIGSVLGLTQFRIKRLYAYSTISHLGFLLLALTINSLESIQSFVFYLIQYSLSNLNAFLLLIAIGYSLYLYVDTKQKNKSNYNLDVSDRNNSPVQLISEIKGYFYVNPVLAISLAITLFSFVGVPPLIGFFAKQMILVSAIDKGYLFMVLVAILTSVISACYYLALVKEIFFFNTDYALIPGINKWNINLYSEDDSSKNKLGYKNIHLNSFLSISISLLTLMVLLFILIPQEWLNMTTIITLIFFNC